MSGANNGRASRGGGLQEWRRDRRLFLESVRRELQRALNFCARNRAAQAKAYRLRWNAAGRERVARDHAKSSPAHVSGKSGARPTLGQLKPSVEAGGIGLQSDRWQ